LPLTAQPSIDGSGEASGKRDACTLSHDLRLRWSSDLASGVYATPVLTDLRSDGQKEVVAGTFTRYVEAVEGTDGHAAPGWPFGFLRSAFHSAPLIHYVDGDGIQDVILTTNDAEIVFMREDGMPMHGR